MIFKRFFFIVFLFLGIHTAGASTHDYVVERAYFEDQTNALNLSQVKEKPFKTFPGMLTKSYSQSTFWVRIKIAPPLKAVHDHQLVLKIQPTYLDTVELFDDAEPARLGRVLGDRHPYANNERKSLTYDFVIPVSETPRYAWIRLKTSSTSLMQFSVVEEDDAQLIDKKLEMASAAIFSALIVFICWALIQWWVTRERLVGIFIIRQLLGLGFFTAYVGYLRVLLDGHISPSALDLTTSFFVLSSSAGALWFHWEFFKEYLISPRWQAIFKGILLAYLCIGTFFAIGAIGLALKINMIIVMLAPYLMLWLSMFGIPWEKLRSSVKVLPKGYLIVAHGLYWLVVNLATLPSLGLASDGVFSPHTVLLHSLVTSIVLVFMIFYRAKRIEEKQAVDMAVAEEQVYAEKSKREEQGHFLEMLTHEFKTSLSVLKMALGSVDLASKEGQYASRAIDNMNDVIERCLQVQALNDDQIQIQLDKVDLLDLLNKVVMGTHSADRFVLSFERALCVRSDEALLKVILANLVDNALKYSKPKSEIQIAVKVEQDMVCVTISNEMGNAGRPDRAQIFSKYYRSERAHEQVGSGLGLYLTAQFATKLAAELHYLPTSTDKPSLVEFKLCLKQ